MADFTSTRLSLNRNPLSYSKVRHALGPVMRAWPFKKRPAVGAYLNVGCGPFARPGFFNIDYDFHDNVDLFHDLRRPLPIDDRSVKGIFTEHCLEHIEFEDARFALSELCRVLQPGGALRISVPDAEGYVRRYLSGEPQPYAANEALSTGYTAVMSLNRIFNGSGHRFIYDFETLSALLTACGFTNIVRETFGHGRDPVLLLDQEDRAPESLYVEATRP